MSALHPKVKLYYEEIGQRFKSNLLRVHDELAGFVEDAIDMNVLNGIKADIVNGIMPQVRKHLEEMTPQDMIEGFIHCSRSQEDKMDGTKFKERKYPEYWDILSHLPTLQEYKSELKKSVEECKALHPDVEEFFVHKIHIIFPKVEPLKDIIQTIYHHVNSKGESFLSIQDKKLLCVLFRSFPVLAIKYINLGRNPVLEDGKQLKTKSNGRILYDGNNGYFGDISVKNAMKVFEIEIEDMIPK